MANTLKGNERLIERDGSVSSELHNYLLDISRRLSRIERDARGTVVSSSFKSLSLESRSSIERERRIQEAALSGARNESERELSRNKFERTVISEGAGADGIADRVSYIEVSSLIPGPRGAKGLKGEQGDAGVTGATGGTGQSGSRGPSGLRGGMGQVGIQGIPGVNGNNGSTGNSGPSGPRGLVGDVGPEGYDGIINPRPTWTGSINVNKTSNTITFSWSFSLGVHVISRATVSLNVRSGGSILNQDRGVSISGSSGSITRNWSVSGADHVNMVFQVNFRRRNGFLVWDWSPAGAWTPTGGYSQNTGWNTG